MVTKAERIHHNLFKDFSIILLSILVAILLVRSGILVETLRYSRFEFFNSFFSGLFFTSVFTTAPAVANFGTIMREYSIFWTALGGAIGAVLGDIVIFRFIRDRFGDDLIDAIKEKHLGRKTKKMLKLRFVRWSLFLISGMIIASPLPDELGLGLLGFLKMKTSRFIPLSFVFNFIGIIIIGLVAKSL